MAGELQGIGPYRLLEVIGEGERAVVYRAVPSDGSDDDMPVAVKVLRPFLEQEDGVSEDLQDRIDVARGLSHPHIVRGLDSGIADGRPYGVSALCDGICLEDLPLRKKSGRLKPEPALTVLHGVLSALAAGGEAEDGPFIHGNLDAGDVLLDDAGDVRVAGFGIPGDPQADLRSVARLAQELCRQWPMRVDAWVDRLKDGDDAFVDARAALDGFPMDAFPEGVLATGQTILARAVRRVLRKRVKETDGTADTQAPTGAPVGPAEVDTAAIAQATAVAWVCAAVVLLAVTIEIVSYGP